MLKQIPLIYEVHSGLLARLNQLDKKKMHHYKQQQEHTMN